MTFSRRIARVAPLVVLVSSLAACATASSAEPVATSLVDLPPSYRFEPEVISVPDGTTVTWTNHDNFTHNVRLLDDGGETLPLPPGESVSFTFTGPGEHRYDCSFHPHDMSGVVIVSDS
jgi:plastocyanin